MQPSSLKELSANRLARMSINRLKKIIKPREVPHDILPLVCISIIKRTIEERIKESDRRYKFVVSVCKEDFTYKGDWKCRVKNMNTRISIDKRGNSIYILHTFQCLISMRRFLKGFLKRNNFSIGYECSSWGLHPDIQFLHIPNKSRNIHGNPVFFLDNEDIGFDYSLKRISSDQIGFDWETLEIFPPES